MQLTRIQRPGATSGSLYFAQTRDDVILELEGLDARPGERFVVITSSGCLPLSLLATGATDVVAVDANTTQNDLVELKVRAFERLKYREALEFLGYAPARRSVRAMRYEWIRTELGAAARAYWDGHRRQLEHGAVRAGVTERFLAVLGWFVRRFVQGRRRVDRLLECRSLEQQTRLYTREWNRFPWRLLFHLVANRLVFHKVYHPSFFAHVDNPSFARHFLSVWERTLTELPVENNFYLHQLFTGYYPIERPSALHPYLSRAGVERLRGEDRRLTLVDGGLLEVLRAQAPGSVHGFALSNICEWLDEREIDALFEAMARVAAPNARLCFRNFLGWTEVPERWRDVFVEDVTAGHALIRRDRSLMQRRFVLCHVR